ncbi:MAG: VOC family protein [Nitrospirae bacterium]|nr:VOC family protein [Nitrospirota bacterium]
MKEQKYSPLGLKGIGHIEILVRDLQSCCEFYKEKIGWVISERTEDFVNFEVLGVPFSLLAVKPLPTAVSIEMPQNSVILLFLVDDCDEVVSELIAKGVHFISMPSDKPWGRVAEFCDPEGNKWQVVKKNV